MLNNNNFPFKNKRAKPSPFIVDLGRSQALKPAPNNISFANQRQRRPVAASWDKTAKTKLVARQIKSARLKWVNSYCSQLTIVSLFAFFYYLLSPLIKLFFSLAYWLGWLTVFCLRFVWLAAKKIKKLTAFISPRLLAKTEAKTTAANYLLSYEFGSSLAAAQSKKFTSKKNQLQKRNFNVWERENFSALKPGNYLIQPPKPWHWAVKGFIIRVLGQFFSLMKIILAPTIKLSRLFLVFGQKIRQQLTHWPKVIFSILFLRQNNSMAFGIAFRRAISFALVVLFLILPFKAYTYYQAISFSVKGQVLGVSEQAVKNIITASQQAADFSLAQAQDNFFAASQDFSRAQSLLNNINDALFVLASFVPSSKWRLASQGKTFLNIGQKVSLLGQELAAATDNIFSLLPFQPAAKQAMVSQSGPNLKLAVSHINQASCLAEQIDNLVAGIPLDILANEHRPKLVLLKKEAHNLNSILASLNDLSYWLYQFLGGEKDKRYLLVFQNNAEARPTGGFIGSYALIDISAGKIKHWEAPAGGSYDTAGGLTEFIAAPKPLQLIQPRWFFWDANWWPDWPTSAKKLAWFLEKSDGPTVDGVISFTPDVAERLLAVIGPIKLGPPYNVIIDKNNFWPTVQAFAEQKPPQTNKPKQIIGDLMAQILTNLKTQGLTKEKIIRLAQTWQQCLAEKHILVYLSDHKMENQVKEFGWGGEVLPAPQDYLMVVNTNIGGGKSDYAISQTIEHQTTIQANGQIIDTVKIIRRHQGGPNSFTQVRNIDWLRIYVPLGSQLLTAEGFIPPPKNKFEIPDSSWQIDNQLKAEDQSAYYHQPSGTKVYTENGKTVFANWSQVDAGKITVIYLKYLLPFKFSELDAAKEAKTSWLSSVANLLFNAKPHFYSYSLLAQKQAGDRQTVLVKKIVIDKFFTLAFSHPVASSKVSQKNKQIWTVNRALREDSFFSFLFYPHF